MSISGCLISASLLLIISFTLEASSSQQVKSLSLIRQTRESAKVSFAPVDGKRSVVCYYNNKAALRPSKGKLTIDQVDPNLCSHLIYGYVGLETSGKVKFYLPQVDLDDNQGLGQLRKFVALKKQNPDLKTLIGIEGGSEEYGKVSSSPKLRATFARSILELLDKFGLDGADLVWKYPNDPRGQPQDKKNYVALVKDVKDAFKATDRILTASVAVGRRRVEFGFDVPQMSKLLDLVNLMTYDYNGGWDNETGLHAPLYGSPKFDLSDKDAELNVDWSVSHWLEKGAKANKLSLGITTYGRPFALKSDSDHDINSPTKKTNPRKGPYTNNDKLMGYNEICEAIKSEPDGWIQERDSDYKSPYATKDTLWVGYEDPESAKLKAEYALARGLASVTITSIDLDDFTGFCGSSSDESSESANKWPIVKAVKFALNGEEEAVAAESPTQNSASVSARIADTTTTITAPNSRPDASNLPTCGRGGQWYFPGPSCREYFDCTTGDPVLKSCGEGYVWRTQKRWCDHAKDDNECPTNKR